jgi:citrate lyase subunit beta/citryl-CoA lyase
VPIVNRIFAPDAEETAFARKVITAFAEAESVGSASIVVDGVFVDYPIVNKARRIVALADVIAAREIGRSRAAAGATK